MGARALGYGGRRQPHLQVLIAPKDRLSLNLPTLDDAACRREDPEVFFSEAASLVDYAKSVCGRCPAQTACLEQSLADGEEHGVFGGLTARERRKLRRERKGEAA
ncbi:WhiB family transcriptional regulator [Streptomyces sp. NPDC059717]|uniref:WhiB family transcriptional regulator n=1 Tax=Streptomyces sp. NPDC059717 TaxID=3346922 RepID=UPI0036B830B9